MSIGAGAFVRAARGHEAAGVACQDSALVRAGQGEALAVICDGCSSGADSGACAALLASCAAMEWGAGCDWGQDWASRAWSRARAAMEMAGMDAERGPATLLGARLDAASGRLDLALWGDGAVAIVDAQGRVADLWVGESALNMPAYPAYAFGGHMWDDFVEAGGATTWRSGMAGDVCEPRAILSLGASGRHWVGEAIMGPGEMALLLSDGVGAVDGRSLAECVSDLASAKGPGEFAERRARRAIESWMALGRGLGDDFSVAALRMDASVGGGP